MEAFFGPFICSCFCSETGRSPPPGPGGKRLSARLQCLSLSRNLCPNAMPSVSSAFFQAFSRAFKARLPLLAAALWWGSGMGLGFVAAPLLIRHAASVPQAAAFTLEIFQAQTWLALACGVALLLTRPRAPQPPDAALVGLAALGMLLALLVQHAAAPRIAAREPLWHAAGALLYAGQCLCAGVLLWRLARQPGG